MEWLYRIFGLESPRQQLAAALVRVAEAEADCRWLIEQRQDLQRRLDAATAPVDEWKRRALESEARARALQESKADLLERLDKLESLLESGRLRERETQDRLTEQVLGMLPQRRASRDSEQRTGGPAPMMPRSRMELIREAETADFLEAQKLQELANEINSGRVPSEVELEEDQDEFLKTFNRVVSHGRNGGAAGAKEAVGNGSR